MQFKKPNPTHGTHMAPLPSNAGFAAAPAACSQELGRLRGKR